jgi:hypothetical protein
MTDAERISNLIGRLHFWQSMIEQPDLNEKELISVANAIYEAIQEIERLQALVVELGGKP